MIKILLTVAFLLIPQVVFCAPFDPTGPSSTGYVLNGLYYQGGYGNYAWGTYNSIVAALDGTNTRLATESELCSLFEHFGLPINGTTYNIETYATFEQYFPPTFGCEFSDIIDGIFQGEGSLFSFATVIYYEPVHVQTSIRHSCGTLTENSLLYDGVSAWTVTPYNPVPEPASVILLATGLFGALHLKRKS